MDINYDSLKKAKSILKNRIYYQNGGGKRNAKITFEQAKKRFHEYYNNRSQSSIGKLRGKMFDSMYQKKDKFTIKCNPSDTYDEETGLDAGECEKGSAKYLLEEGPRTFDVTGLDYFDEGEEVLIRNDYGNDTSITSKGATYKTDKDTNSTVNDGEKDPENIYGPRIKNIENNQDKLYADYFKDLYEQYRDENTWNSRDDEDGAHLVDEYWRQYHEAESNMQRKNRKTRKLPKRLSSYDSSSSDDELDIFEIEDDVDDMTGDITTEIKLYPFTVDDQEYYLTNELQILLQDKKTIAFDAISNNIDNDILSTLIENEMIINIGDDELPNYIINPEIDSLYVEDDSMSSYSSPAQIDDDDSQEIESPSSSIDDDDSLEIDSSLHEEPDSVEPGQGGLDSLVTPGSSASTDDELDAITDDELMEEISGELFTVLRNEDKYIQMSNGLIAKLIIDENGEFDIDENAETYENLEEFLRENEITENDIEFEEEDE